MIGYKKLWKQLIDKERKTEVSEMARISMLSVAKLYRNENIYTEMLNKICNKLQRNISYIMELIPEQENQSDDDISDENMFKLYRCMFQE